MNPRSLAIELNASGILKPGGGGPTTGGVRRPGLRSPLLAVRFPCGECPIGGGPTSIPRSMLFCLANLSPPTGVISKDSPIVIPCSIILRLTCFGSSWFPRSRSYSWEVTRGLGTDIPVEFCRCMLGFTGSPGLISGTEIIFRTVGSRGR